MVKLLIIADDFTGALDTGVQFVKQGIRTQVSTTAEMDLSNIPEEIQVLSVDLETRHLPPKQAYEKVKIAAKAAREKGIKHVYKKTDSTLRGNIGAELSALMDAFEGNPMAFIPAYPANGRTTSQGYQLVDGLPVHNTQFAVDSLNPVTESFIPHIIGMQCDKKVELAYVDSCKCSEKNTIYVFDAETEEQLANVSAGLKGNGFSGSLAGCAGLAGYLPGFFGLRAELNRKNRTVEHGSMLIVCGSVNQVSIEQCQYAFTKGISGVTLTPRQKFEYGYWNTSEGISEISVYSAICKKEGRLLISSCTNSEEAQNMELPVGITAGSIAEQISVLIETLINRGDISRLVVFGGDTAIAIMNRLGVSCITPFAELLPGVVASTMAASGRELMMVTKAGGFGTIDTLVKTIELINI